LSDIKKICRGFLVSIRANPFSSPVFDPAWSYFFPDTANPTPGFIANDEAPFIGRHSTGMVGAKSSSGYVGGRFGNFG
jgi:hypothetical protein